MDASWALSNPPTSGRIDVMRKDPAKGGHSVAVVVGNGMAPFEFAVACEVFGVDRSDLGVPWYRFMVCAAEPPPVRTEVGFTIDAPHGLADLRRADTIVVPAIYDAKHDAPPALLDALRAAHHRGARILS